jgi:glutamine amidotransferase
MMQIAIIDLGIGNLRSVQQALVTVAPDADIVITADAERIDAADKIVLPGQGAIATWFTALAERQLKSVLQRALKEKPLLGICVGMQALFDSSEEDGGIEGLGLFSGKVRHFRNFHSPVPTVSENKDLKGEGRAVYNWLKIPHMGWNQVSQTHGHPLWAGIEDSACFYFVHSYCANSDSAADVSAIKGETDFGHRFVSAIGRNNIFAVQFHPEKSHADGLQLLSNFTQWSGQV